MRVYPVVHINAPEFALEQAEGALDAGADGVYVISHRGRNEHVFETLEELKRRRPESYVGINLLGTTALEAMTVLCARADAQAAVPSALWVDDIRQGSTTVELPLQMKNAHPQLGSLRLLGGIAFKYTPTFTDDPEEAARETRQLIDAVDVVTTSGQGTGLAPNSKKLAAIKRAAGGKPVAVASGISAENIHTYAGSVDEVLVASSIETAPYSGIFDEQKLNTLIYRAHNTP